MTTETQQEARAQALDAADMLADLRTRFVLDPSLVYLDGNSLGPMLASIPARLEAGLHEEWAKGLIRSWNSADWISLPERIGRQIALLVGAEPSCVTVTDSTSVNLFKVLAAALSLQKDRKQIVSEKDNFPTDLYMVDGLTELLGGNHCLDLASGGLFAGEADEDKIMDLISEETAVVLLTQVDFRTGRMLDMERLTRAAHEKGALVIWDLAHSAGALPVALDAVGADFAVGCGYKYLNGGPGAPSFVYANKRHLGKITQPLTGWFSHKSPFDFSHEYSASGTIDQFLCGTPPVLSMLALEEALKIWADVSPEQVRQKSLGLSDFFVECLEAFELMDVFSLATPVEHARRGSQVSLRFDGDGYAIMQALIASNVIGDYRDPDILRFGFAPLYNSYDEVFRAAKTLARIMREESWKRAEFSTRKAVT